MLIPVIEASQTGNARRRAIALAEELEMSESLCGAVALATTEMATNLVKHAKSGHILLQKFGENGRSGIRVIAVDKGPGIGDISKAFSDGHSTAGSLGTGLGAIRRASSGFDIYTIPALGTVILAEFCKAKKEHTFKDFKVEVGVVSEPLHGEDVCGDGWTVREIGRSILLMVVDGLGHGLAASDAAREAERTLENTKHTALKEILHEVHNELRKTRGAAIGLARIDSDRRLMSFAGIGNVLSSIVTPGSSRSVPSHNGIIGQSIERVQEFTLPWNDDSVLVMHSDGLGSRWDMERYPGIWGKHPSVMAAVLHRDFVRGRDDVTVLVAKVVSN